ncbi:MAG: hypothetical protein H6Q05_1594 [Acidobacteria bacterium]|jgi:hypothetical protein|nr:hypothetical protein [Acidobacteriota bacterium]
MRKTGFRHYSEEELLMHFLQEETEEVGQEISVHLRECGECDSIFKEYGYLVGQVQAWRVPEIPESVWQTRKSRLLLQFREDLERSKGRGMLSSLRAAIQSAWDYALEHPLPTLGYIAIAIAFALERTISTFRLDRVLPGASDVFEILRQVF